MQQRSVPFYDPSNQARGYMTRKMAARLERRGVAHLDPAGVLHLIPSDYSPAPAITHSPTLRIVPAPQDQVYDSGLGQTFLRYPHISQSTRCA